HRGSGPALARALGTGAAAPRGTGGHRFAPARARRDLEPCTQRSWLCGVLVRAGSDFDRAIAGCPVRSFRPGADRAELPALALLGNGGRIDDNRIALPRRGAYTQLLRQLCLDARHQDRSQGGGGLPAPALCRAFARVGDRRSIVPPGALAPAT